MKLATLSMLLGAALLSNAHAAEQGNAAVPPQKSLDMQADTAKKPKAVRGKKKGVKKKVIPGKQEGAMMDPSESTEQSVQLRGVRG